MAHDLATSLKAAVLNTLGCNLLATHLTPVRPKTKHSTTPFLYNPFLVAMTSFMTQIRVTAQHVFVVCTLSEGLSLSLSLFNFRQPKMSCCACT
jgi:hypothetical protein